MTAIWFFTEGANHFSIAEPLDPTLSTPFLDFPATQPGDKVRSVMAQTIGLFIDTHVRHQPTASQALKQLLAPANPLVWFFDCKYSNRT